MNKKKRKKTTERQRVIKALDRLWSESVKIRDSHLCQWCLHDGVINNSHIHSHHIKGRARLSTRFYLMNGVSLCYRCHFHRIKQNPIEYRDFLFRFLGLGNIRNGKAKYKCLCDLSEMLWTPTVEELKEKLKENKSEQDNLM